jgi:hypothetical protein
VRLEIAYHDATASLAVPATSLRAALLSAQPQLKALSELPEAPWSTRTLRLPGKPGLAAEITHAVQLAIADMRCPTCQGKGRIDPQNAMNAPGGGGRGGRGGPGGPNNGQGNGPNGGFGSRPCPMCHGEKSAAQGPLLTDLAELALSGARTVWAPTTDEHARAQVRSDAALLMKTLMGVGPHFDQALGTAFDKPGGVFPRGTVLRAEVRESKEGPDGTYLILAPYRSTTLVGVRVDDLLTMGGKAPARDRKVPGVGSWVAVIGAVISKMDTGDEQGLAVLPMDWMPALVPVPPPGPQWPGRGGNGGGNGGNPGGNPPDPGQ